MTADMPEEIWIRADDAEGTRNYYRGKPDKGMRYIRADLAEKPAPMDAEVQEAVVIVRKYGFDKWDVCSHPDCTHPIADAVNTLIRAAEKVAGLEWIIKDYRMCAKQAATKNMGERE